MRWEVLMNGRSIGVVETNYAWAKAYWAEREIARMAYDGVPVKFTLVMIEG